MSYRRKQESKVCLPTGVSLTTHIILGYPVVYFTFCLKALESMKLLEVLITTVRLYEEAIRSTGRSFVRGWIISVAVVIFAFLLLIAGRIAVPFGVVGGLIMGVVNALLFGTTLSLIEQAVLGRGRMGWRDIWNSFGHYFWDVVGVGFVLWIPVLVLEQGAAAIPHGTFLAAFAFVLLFIFLNPAPEVIYQMQHGSPLDVIRESYEFVMENWIEWFIPVGIAVAPMGMSFFIVMTSFLGSSGGLNFFQLLFLPFSLLTQWLVLLGLTPIASSIMVILLTPPIAVAILLFRGHLFANLRGSTRRQRLFRNKGWG
jgi:hypothetical protein